MFGFLFYFYRTFVLLAILTELKYTRMVRKTI